MGIFTRSVEVRDAFPERPIPSNGSLVDTGSARLRGVNLSRAEAALQKVAVWSAVNLIASMGGGIPVGVYRGEGRDKKQLKMPSWLADLGADGHGLGDFVWQLLYCAAMRGNVVGRVVERQPQTGLPSVIDLKHPDDVTATPTSPGAGNASGLAWRFGQQVVPTDQVWHQRVYPVPGRALGLSPIAVHALTVSQGIYAQQFGAQWFLDGATPSGLLTNETAKSIGQPEAVTVKQRFLSAVRGTREPVVLTGGWKYQAISVPPNESQFLETMGYTSAECARIYGPGMPEILGYETGGSMTYANVEQRSIDLLRYTLDPWFVRVERWLSALLPSPQYVLLDRDALLRTDTMTRWTAHQTALKNGAKVINEVRAVEDLPPVSWGDEPYLPALGGSAAGNAVATGTVDDVDNSTDTKPADPAPALAGGTP